MSLATLCEDETHGTNEKIRLETSIDNVPSQEMNQNEVLDFNEKIRLETSIDIYNAQSLAKSKFVAQLNQNEVIDINEKKRLETSVDIGNAPSHAKSKVKAQVPSNAKTKVNIQINQNIPRLVKSGPVRHPSLLNHELAPRYGHRKPQMSNTPYRVEMHSRIPVHSYTYYGPAVRHINGQQTSLGHGQTSNFNANHQAMGTPRIQGTSFIHEGTPVRGLNDGMGPQGQGYSRQPMYNNPSCEIMSSIYPPQCIVSQDEFYNTHPYERMQLRIPVHHYPLKNGAPMRHEPNGISSMTHDHPQRYSIGPYDQPEKYRRQSALGYQYSRPPAPFYYPSGPSTPQNQRNQRHYYQGIQYYQYPGNQPYDIPENFIRSSPTHGQYYGHQNVNQNRYPQLMNRYYNNGAPIKQEQYQRLQFSRPNAVNLYYENPSDVRECYPDEEGKIICSKCLISFLALHKKKNNHSMYQPLNLVYVQNATVHLDPIRFRHTDPVLVAASRNHQNGVVGPMGYESKVFII